MKNLKMSLTHRIFLSFFILIFFFVVNAVISYLTFNRNEKISIKNSAVIDPSLKALDEFNYMLSESKMLSTNWVYLRSNDVDKKALVKLQQRSYPALKNKFIPLLKEWDNKTSTKEMVAVFKDFDALIEVEKGIMSSLVTFRDYDDPFLKMDGETAIEDEVIPMTAALQIKLDKIGKQLNIQKMECQAELTSSSKILNYSIIWLSFILIVLSLIFSLYMSGSITKPVIRIKEVINSLGKGQLSELNMPDRGDEIGEMMGSVKNLVSALGKTTTFAEDIGNGNLNSSYTPLSDKDVLGKALIDMRENLRNNAIEDQKRYWVNSGLAQAGELLQANSENLDEYYRNIVSFLVTYTKASHGCMYIAKEFEDNEVILALAAGYALSNSEQIRTIIQPGEGMIGQVYLDHKMVMLENTPDNYLKINSGLGEAAPKSIAVVPVLFMHEVKGVLEVSTFNDFGDIEEEFLEKFSKLLGSTLDMLSRKLKTESLLAQSQTLNEKLRAQEEELKASNEQLMVKSNLLESSREKLQSQQEELMKTYSQMEEKAQLLAENNEAIRIKNGELEIIREAISLKAEELELSNKYKAEFLANMSHELRTPLNSILILSNLLMENPENKLTEKQVSYANIIQRSGKDLLKLINDILDLAKLESRKIQLEPAEFDLKSMLADIRSLFEEMATGKSIDFKTNLTENTPELCYSDRTRIEQVVKNLLSNAFKFTPKDGSVEFNIYKLNEHVNFRNSTLKTEDGVICMEVKDSGIGIPKDKLNLIFEAFQQADGSTSRKYGGTGLGLSISRELALILGGELQVESVTGEGSTFRLYLPFRIPEQISDISPDELIGDHTVNDISLNSNQKVVLPLVSLNGHSTNGLTTNGLNGSDLHSGRNLYGIDQHSHDNTILIIEDDEIFAEVLKDCTIRNGFKTIIATDGQTGLEMARKHNPSAILLDIGLPVMDGWTVMQNLKSDGDLEHIPVHIISGGEFRQKSLDYGAVEFHQKPLTVQQLDEVCHRLLEKQLDETRLFLSALGNGSYQNNGVPIKDNAIPHQSLKGRKILLVDDDMRNIFALSHFLEKHELNLVVANDGQEALNRLDENPDIDLVLMDIMMPEMDGYEATRRIRQEKIHSTLPVIALTANAMKGDREKCLAAGASDYISKPVNTDQLISMMRVWLYQ